MSMFSYIFISADLLKSNHGETEGINSLTTISRDAMKEMEAAHSNKITEITKDAEKCLIIEYMVVNTKELHFFFLFRYNLH